MPNAEKFVLFFLLPLLKSSSLYTIGKSPGLTCTTWAGYLASLRLGEAVRSSCLNWPFLIALAPAASLPSSLMDWPLESNTVYLLPSVGAFVLGLNMFLSYYDVMFKI